MAKDFVNGLVNFVRYSLTPNANIERVLRQTDQADAYDIAREDYYQDDVAIKTPELLPHVQRVIENNRFYRVMHRKEQLETIVRLSAEGESAYAEQYAQAELLGRIAEQKQVKQKKGSWLKKLFKLGVSRLLKPVFKLLATVVKYVFKFVSKLLGRGLSKLLGKDLGKLLGKFGKNLKWFSTVFRGASTLARILIHVGLRAVGFLVTNPIGLAILATLGGGAWLWHRFQSNKDESSVATTSTQPSSSSKSKPKANVNKTSPSTSNGDSGVAVAKATNPTSKEDLSKGQVLTPLEEPTFEEPKKYGKPRKIPSWRTFEALDRASKIVGIPLDWFIRVAHIESGFNPTAASGTGAKGLFQFTGSLWKAVNRHKQMGGKYRKYLGKVPSRNSAFHQAIMAGAWWKEEIFPIIKTLAPGGINIINTYVGHNIGGPEARRFFKALRRNPNTPYHRVFEDKNTARNNPKIYRGIRTVGEAYARYKKYIGGYNAQATIDEAYSQYATKFAELNRSVPNQDRQQDVAKNTNATPSPVRVASDDPERVFTGANGIPYKV